MFTIYGGKTEFTQWDLGQKVVNPNMCDCEQVVFRMSNGDSDVSRAYEFEGQMVADVPNELLTRNGRMMVDLGQGQNRRMSETTYFDVVPADKPKGYVCTDNRSLKKKYLETTEQQLTDAEKAQVRKNIGAGEGTGGGVTDYNKLENTPCKAEMVEVLPETTVEIVDGGAEFVATVPLTEGQNCTVKWNGTEYRCVCSTKVDNGVTLFNLGNMGVLEGTGDTGEPFVFVSMPDMGGCGVFALDGSTSATLSIIGEVIEKMDEKFLPTTRMVVNFTKVNSDTTANAKADKTVAQIVAAVNDGAHVEGRYITNGYTYVLQLCVAPVDAADVVGGDLFFWTVDGTKNITAVYMKTEDGTELFTVSI